jgi:hypothetical protein
MKENNEIFKGIKNTFIRISDYYKKLENKKLENIINKKNKSDKKNLIKDKNNKYNFFNNNINLLNPSNNLSTNISLNSNSKNIIKNIKDNIEKNKNTSNYLSNSSFLQTQNLYYDYKKMNLKKTNDENNDGIIITYKDKNNINKNNEVDIYDINFNKRKYDEIDNSNYRKIFQLENSYNHPNKFHNLSNYNEKYFQKIVIKSLYKDNKKKSSKK